MDNKDEMMFFAGMALMGLVARGEAPSSAGQQAWQYAQFMINFKPKEQGNDN
jgi:hypothetical protein